MPKAHVPNTVYGDADTVQAAIVKTRDAWNSGGVDHMRTQPRRGRTRRLDDDIRDLVVKRIEGIFNNGEPFTAVTIHGYLKKTPLM